MKLSVSNIAWAESYTDRALELLSVSNIQGVEVAPTKIHSDWNTLSISKVVDYKAKLDSYGLKVPALQSICFNRPELQVFVAESHTKFFEHLKKVIEIMNILEANVLVFGCPQNRSFAESYPYFKEFAESFFHKLSDLCHTYGGKIALEPLPKAYNNNFLINYEEVYEFTQNIRSKYIGINLDLGILDMTGEDYIWPSESIFHCHISAPHLVPVKSMIKNKSILRKLNLPSSTWATLEMKDHGLLALQHSIGEVIGTFEEIKDS